MGLRASHNDDTLLSKQEFFHSFTSTADKIKAFTSSSANLQFYSVPNTLRFGLILKRPTRRSKQSIELRIPGVKKHIRKTKSKNMDEETRVKQRPHRRIDHDTLQRGLHMIIKGEYPDVICKPIILSNSMLRGIP
jgi:hypothetical protein